MKKVDIWSPLPPVSSGIANYTQAVFGDGLTDIDIKFISSPSEKARADAEQLYQLGNNPHHEYVLHAALSRPGIIDIHDFSLHHLVTHMTLARGDRVGYEYLLSSAIGENGIKLARGRQAGRFHEHLEFELPLLEPVCRQSKHVIVRSRWARQRVKMVDADQSLSLIPHFCPTPNDEHDQEAQRKSIREKYKIKSSDKLILSAGFVTRPKLVGLIMDALAECYNDGQRNFRLIIAGDVQDYDVLSKIKSFPNPKKITVLGYTNDQSFDALFSASDIVPTLRWPSVGEASGVIARAIGSGVHAIALDQKTFSDLPSELVTLLPLSSREGIQNELTRTFANLLNQDELCVNAEMRKQYLDDIAGIDAVRRAYRNLFMTFN